MIINFKVDPRMIKQITTVNNTFNKIENFPLLSIGKDSYIVSSQIHTSVNLDTDYVHNIQAGSYCSFATNLTLMIDMNHDYRSVTTATASFLNGCEKTIRVRRKGQIIIQNDVWIGHNVILMSGIKIGNGAVIGAGSVVTKDIPPYSIVAGNPCKVIKYRFSSEQIEKLQLIRWWDFDEQTLQDNADIFSKDIDTFIDRFYPEALVNKQKLYDIGLKKNSTTYLFFSDAEASYSIFEKVVRAFCAKFTCFDDVTLLFCIHNKINEQYQIGFLENITKEYQDCPDILIIDEDFLDERLLFMQANYFITTRDINTVRWSTYADEFDVKLLSGVDIPIF